MSDKDIVVGFLFYICNYFIYIMFLMNLILNLGSMGLQQACILKWINSLLINQ